MLHAMLELIANIAKAQGGYSALWDKHGNFIVAMDSSGEAVKNGKINRLNGAKKIIEGGFAGQIKSPFKSDDVMWVIPFGDYIIGGHKECFSSYEKKLFNIISDALPHISKITGGDAVMFDAKGVRTHSVNSKGEISDEFIGKESDAAKKAMEDGVAVIGESNYIVGSRAIRIPLSPNFGFGFNNDDTVQSRQKLIDEIRKNKIARFTFNDIITKSPKKQQIIATAVALAKTDDNVLIIGEAGTGKETFAGAMHNASERWHKPFITVNCGTIDETLIESTFFGYEDAIFKGVKRGGSSGAFEEANGGTLLIIGIHKLDMDMQNKVLKVIQSGEVSRIGSRKKIKVDVRIFCADSQRINEMQQNKTFAQTIYNEISKGILHLPPLREIKEDIPLFVEYFIRRLNKNYGKFVETVDQDAIEMLCSYNWKGNIGELHSVIENIFMIIGTDTKIKKIYLPIKLKNNAMNGNNMEEGAIQTNLAELMNQYEKEIITAALKANGASKLKTAKYLGISTTSLWRRIKTLEIDG